MDEGIVVKHTRTHTHTNAKKRVLKTNERDVALVQENQNAFACSEAVQVPTASDKLFLV